MVVSETDTVLWVVRHGERRDFVDNAWLHSAPFPMDPPLTDEGVDMARKVGEYIRSRYETIDVVYTSPFLRTVQTAQAVVEALEAPLRVRVEHGIGEYLTAKFGRSPLPDLKSMEDLLSLHPILDAEYSTVGSLSYPESSQEMNERFKDIVNHLTTEHSGENLLLVSHGAGCEATLRAVWPETPLGRINFHYCGLSKMIKPAGSDRWKVEFFNKVVY